MSSTFSSDVHIEDIESDLLEDKDRLNLGMKKAGFTFSRLVGEGHEEVVFVNKDGAEIVVSQHTISFGGGNASGAGFNFDEPPDSENNIRSHIELAKVGGAVMPEGAYFVGVSQLDYDIAAYVADLAGMQMLNAGQAGQLDAVTKARIDDIWDEMNPNQSPAPQALGFMSNVSESARNEVLMEIRPSPM
jgi:hypothetical protein